MIPLATVRLGELFRARKEPGIEGLPILSVTMTEGLVHRDVLERRTNGNLAPEEHLLIRRGDLAYNMMRMWQGASGLADKDGMVSPAYVVLAPREGIDPLFASYWFKSARMIHLFWAHSYGLTSDRLRLYYKDFARIPVRVPSKPEQERIGHLLARTDRAIELMQKLITAKRKFKGGLAQQLLTGQRRLPGFTEPWTMQSLDTISRIGKGAGGSKSDLAPAGLPVVRYGELYTTYRIRIDQVRSFISPDAARRSRPIDRGDVLLAGSGEDRDEIGVAAAYTANCPAFAGGDVIIVSSHKLHSVFLAYLLGSMAVRREFYRRAQGESVVHLYMRDVGSLQLQLPSIEEQKCIAAVLGEADREIALLSQKVMALHRLKTGFMQSLLTDGVRRKGQGST